MKKLYQKNEQTFAIVWIVAYVVLFSLADALSESTGIPKLYTMFLSFAAAAVLLGFICKNGLKEYYGLCRVQGGMKSYLYFLPLILLSTCNLWNGLAMPESLLKALPAAVTMAVAGLLEELIFRGLLFKAMYKDSRKAAVIVGSLTFGMGHIVNLLNGAPLLETLLQIAYATAIGYLFIVIFLKSGSIVPCIIAHCFINGTSRFGRDGGDLLSILTAAVLVIVPVAYALWLSRKTADQAA
ncbi:MAG: CPBP family intramembrane metalloprotease [Clostridia bacterium]|nr:CPBP family intramembrane metalloprotease [Clostridia bacterium]